MARKRTRSTKHLPNANATMPLTTPEDISRLLTEAAGDKLVLDAFQQYELGTMKERAAAQSICAAALIAAARPHLTEACLRPAVQRCHALGADIPIWVTTFGEAVSRYPDFEAIAGPEGTRWLRETLPEHEELIVRLIAESRAKEQASGSAKARK